MQVLVRKPLLLIVFCVLCYNIFAQGTDYQFSRLNISNGLSNNQVTSIFKDSRGFMWFGTTAGLNRYDGYKFKVYKHLAGDTTSLNDNYVINITEGPNNKLWIKTKSNLNIYDPTTEQFTTNLSPYLKNIGIKSAQIADIFKISDSIYLLSGRQTGMYLYNNVNHQTSYYYHKNNNNTSINSTGITNAIADAKANVWIMHRDGFLEKFNLTKNTVQYRINVLRKPEEAGLAYTLFMDSEKCLWIFCTGGDNGLYYFDPSKLLLKHFGKEMAEGGLSSNIINNVTQANDGMVWIATDHGGITLLNKKNWQKQYLINKDDDSKSISQNSILSVYKDNLGIIWAGTYKKGINFYHQNIIKFPIIHHFSSDPNSLPYDDVNRFAEDAKGNLWIGTNGGGLIYYNRQSGKFIQYKHSFSNTNSIGNDVIVSLLIDHDQKLWIGSYYGGLDSFDGKTFTHYKHDDNNPSSLSDDRVWQIIEDAENNLWVGTLAGGLNRFDRRLNKFFHYLPNGNNSISAAYVSSILEDKQGNIWAGTSAGVDEIKKSGQITHYRYNDTRDDALVHNTINSLFIDSRGWIWIATLEGLSMLNNDTGKFKNFTTKQGLPDNNIKGILEDNFNNIWISTAKGVSKMTVSKTESGLSCHFQNFDEADGLQGLDFNERSAFKTRNGELIFGGANGFNIFSPASITSSINTPVVVLTDFQIFNKDIAPGQQVNGHLILSKSIAETKKISLDYDENVFSIEFSALDFFNADKIKISYILEGYDKAWLTADFNTRKVTYTNLSPGTYTFKISAENSEQKSKILNLTITVKPPFWKTNFAYLIYILLFGASLYYIRRRGIRKIKDQFAIEQERQQAHRLHELDLMKIKFFTNVSHEFRTPLSLILAPVDKILKQIQNPDHIQQLQLINRNARRLLNMVNQLLDFRKIEVQELNLHNNRGDIISFIEEVAMSFTDIAEKKNINFVFDSDIDQFETDFDHDKIERILFNLISNAFKFTHENGHISVLLNLKDGSRQGYHLLEIKIVDTGIGIPNDKIDKIFERFFQNEVPGYMVNQGSGIGLAITKEFVKLHQGEIIVESEPEVGSCFIVRLPIIAAGEEEVLTVTAPSLQHTENPKAVSNEILHGKKQTVLLVEDNDDLRFYLKDNLKEFFNVIEANNGKEGWQKALSLHPAIIVSDISMPEMNGIDLCRKLKHDDRTAQIPVILLTALTGEEEQLKGLATGATDYLTKPFNFEILLSKLKNILQQQDSMRKIYKKQVEINPTNVVLESPDELFIQKALQIIEANISNTEFSVEELSSEMCMSRVTLYKKALALTGKSPVDLIRTVRLKRAAQLLVNGYLTVSQVCYKVGFKSQKYFAKSFKAEFGMLPSAYAANHKEELAQ